jgi:hypothetical protein
MSHDPKQDQELEPDNDVEREYDPVSDGDDGHDKYESSNTTAPATTRGSTARMSLAALQSMLNSVDTSASIGRSGRPLMQFKSRENGTWMFGRSRTVVEDNSLWAFDPRSFMWGYVCFGADKRIVPGGEVLVSVGQPKPDNKLPDKGFPWLEQRAVNMKCVSGIDAGIEVIFKINTYGGIQAVDELIDKVRERLNSGNHDNKVAPIATLKKDSYPHKEYGKTYVPVLTIADWMSLDGPAPAPQPSGPGPGPGTAGAAEQPRRRRVA